MPEDLPSALAVRPWDDCGTIIKVGQVYTVVSESNSEWSYVLGADSETIGWVPSYCFKDDFLHEYKIVKEQLFDDSMPDFLSLKTTDIFKQIYKTTSNDKIDLRYGFVKGTKECGWVDASHLDNSIDHISTDTNEESLTTPALEKPHVESIEQFVERFSLNNGVRYYLTTYLDYSSRKRYTNAVDKTCMLICDFSWYNHLDTSAYNLLFDIPYSIALKVMDHGFFVAAKNNSAVVTSRIRMYTREWDEEKWTISTFQ